MDTAFQQIDVEHATGTYGRIAIRIFGVTEAGHSVLMHVNHFLPYFYVPAPRGFQESHIEGFSTYLQSNFDTTFVKLELVRRRPLLLYRGDDWPTFIKITLNDPKLIPRARDRYFPEIISAATDSRIIYASSIKDSAAIKICLTAKSAPLKVTSSIPFGL